jgi:TolB-like protein/tetratricopeptide (TPR) repeat protein
MHQSRSPRFSDALLCPYDILAFCYCGAMRQPAKRNAETAKLRYFFDSYVIDLNRRELCRGTQAIAVEPKVFDLLEYVIRNRERVVTRDDLIGSIWGGRIVSESALSTRINAARSAIGDTGAEQRLIKTLARKGIRFVGSVREEPSAATEHAAAAMPKPPIAFASRASIAVLPFDNMSGDPEQVYFADGMVEEIITGLAKTSWLFVVARNSSFVYKGKTVDVKQVGRDLGVRYVLEGSVRKSAARIRITGQLVDTATGAHLWADRFDGSLEDVFDLQDKVTATVVGAIEPAMRNAEIQQARRKPTSSLDAYDWYLRALSAFNLPYASRYTDALELCRKALATDPDYAAACALAAWGCAGIYFAAPLSEAKAVKEEGTALARKALDFAANDPIAMAMGAQALSFLSPKDRDRALEAAEHALSLAPNSAQTWIACGHIHYVRSEGDAAIKHFEQALRLSPRDPFAWAIKSGMAAGHFIEGRFAEALDWAEKAQHDNPKFFLPVRIKIAACGHLGRLAEAQDALRAHMETDPDASISKWERVLGAVQSPASESYVEGLRKAGMPD